MGNDESVERTSKIKSKTFRQSLERVSLTLDEYNQGIQKEWEYTNLILHDSILSIYLSSNLENSFEVNKDVYTKINNQGELVIGFSNDKRPTIWKFRSIDCRVVTEWLEALILSKRPRFSKDYSCSLCTSPFSAFRRRHHCRACGKSFCDNCCKTKIKLDILGYDKKKKVCEHCREDIKKITDLFENKKIY